MKDNMIIGIVGGAASGKDTVAGILAQSASGVHISCSDCVREEIRTRGLAVNRSIQREVANEMRRLEGGNYWIKRALSKLERLTGLIIISGLYALGEGEFIKNQGGLIIGVVASLDADQDLSMRYQRLLDRSDGPRDALSYSDFLESSKRENSGSSGYDTNIGQLLRISDEIIINGDGALDGVKLKVESITRSISRGLQ
ncbi:MAG TPA: AAA family ATPase [Candidatus Saccharibacteria bacterium]|nr:AAA family ATPase [Candidatus Saccharibacteria bacterium]